MKQHLIIFSILLLIIPHFLHAQNRIQQSSGFLAEKAESEEIIVTGLRFDKDIIAELKKLPKQPAFIIDKKGVLRPTKDYQIIYVKADKALVVLPKTTSYSTYAKIDGYEDIEVGNMTIGCMCDGGYDNCHFDNRSNENEFICTGSCSCYIGILFDYVKPPLEYETAGGRWFNF